METTPKSNKNAVWRRLRRLVRGVFGPLAACGKLQKMKELEAVMKYWHSQETEAMFKAQEAEACGNLERCAMWIKRCQEARMRCNKDFRRPMEQLTGKPDLFSANDTSHHAQ